MKNKKPLIIGLGIVAAVLVGGIIWNNQHSSADHSSMDMSGNTETTTSAADTGSSTTGKTVTVAMEAGNYYFSPKTITAKKGDTIKITLTGKGMLHDFTLDEFNVSSSVEPGKTTTIEFTVDKAGSFEFYCSIGSHRQRGQVGTLTVE